MSVGDANIEIQRIGLPSICNGIEMVDDGDAGNEGRRYKLSSIDRG